MSLSKEVSHSVNSFSLKLHTKLSKENPNINLFYSPTSICLTLAMAYAGAKGNTAKEIEQAMKWKTQTTVHEMMAILQEDLLLSPDVLGIELKVASRLWAQKGVTILKEFTEILQSCYHTEMGVVDFKNMTEEARRAINSWVEEKTNSKIKGLVQEGVLTCHTRLIATNAIYFKGGWEKQFEEIHTHDYDFKITKTDKTRVKLMNQNGHFLYANYSRLSCQVLKLPYNQEKVAMVILLPDKVNGLAKLERKLDANCLRKCNEILKKKKVFVSLPRFKIDCSFSLKDALQNIGIRDFFAPRSADLSGTAEAEDLFFSDMIHQAFVDVNEEGTEAAAATCLLACKSGSRKKDQIPHFLADHPFLFLIEHCESGTILLAGKIANPGYC